jgi:hypothetical protein
MNFYRIFYEYVSPALNVERRKLSRDDQRDGKVKIDRILRVKDLLVTLQGIRMMFRRSFRRQRMRAVIGELRLLRREQSQRYFPATILDRS